MRANGPCKIPSTTCAPNIWLTRRRSTPPSPACWPAAGTSWARRPPPSRLSSPRPAASTGCVGVNSGTDALHLALRACGVGPGDEVITVAHTAVATVAAIRMAGATPVLVDIDPATYTMDPAALAAAVTPDTKAVIPVHLYGHPADLRASWRITRRHGLWLIEDCAQAHGAPRSGQAGGQFRRPGLFLLLPNQEPGRAGRRRRRGRAVTRRCWSGCACCASTAGRPRRATSRRWRASTAGWTRSRPPCCGSSCATWSRRTSCAGRWRLLYAAALPPGVVLPVERPGCRHVYHLYVVRVPDRDDVRAELAGPGHRHGHPLPRACASPARLCGWRRCERRRLPETERAAAADSLACRMHPALDRSPGGARRPRRWPRVAGRQRLPFPSRHEPARLFAAAAAGCWPTPTGCS